MPPLKTVRGGALLTALFIMTLVAIVATAMSTRLQLDIYKARLIITHDKLYLATQPVMFWTLNELRNKKNVFSKVKKQGMVAEYPENLGTLSQPILVTGGIYDLQALYNLNNLNDKKSFPSFINLLTNLYPTLNKEERMNLALAINHWISTYDLARGKDSYMTYYLNQKPPYYPSHQLISSSSELRLVKDITAPLYAALEPFITALPESTPININTASKQVLKSLGHGLTNAQLNELLTARGEDGISDIKEIGELLQKLDLTPEQITIESSYFLSVAQAKQDEFSMNVYTLFKRIKDKKGKISVHVMREGINSF